jgi:hypothetical protein
MWKIDDKEHRTAALVRKCLLLGGGVAAGAERMLAGVGAAQALGEAGAGLIFPTILASI